MIGLCGWAVVLTTALAVSSDPRVALRFDASEAEAALAIAERHRSGAAVTEREWERLFSTQPYRRLKRREATMQRPFEDREFQDFVLSDSLARRAPELRSTLARWRGRDLTAGARRVLAYLPEGARIHAAVYPMIKPRSNSFVFEAAENAAIFLYLDPAQSAARFENTVAHELHHIGFASVARDTLAQGQPEPVRTAVEWMGAFGEGFAMLAAAGGPDVHPHAASPAAERKRWDRDLARFDHDLAALDSFFVDVIEERLTGEGIRRRGFEFFGEQGPWYTVGYRMAVMVERRFGRATLIGCMIDPRRLLARYNDVARERSARGEPMARWSERLLEEIDAR